MTRPSKRELERALEDLYSDVDDGGTTTIVIEETIVGTGWSAEDGEPASDLDAGETETRTTEVEL